MSKVKKDQSDESQLNSNSILDTMKNQEKFDPNKYVDIMIASMMMKNTASNNYDIFGTVINFIIIMCADDIKKLLKYFIDELTSFLKSIKLLIVDFLLWLSLYVKLLYFDKMIKKQTPNYQPCIFSQNYRDKNKELCIEFELNKVGLLSEPLYKMIKSNGTYNEFLIDQEYCDDKSFFTKKKLDNISIEFNNIKIIFKNPLEIITKCVENKTITFWSIKHASVYPNLKYKNFCELLPPYLGNTIKQLYCEFTKNNKFMTNNIHHFNEYIYCPTLIGKIDKIINVEEKKMTIDCLITLNKLLPNY